MTTAVLTRICKTCNRLKSLDEFYPAGGGKPDLRMVVCKKCHTIRTGETRRKRRRERPAEASAASRRKNLMRKFGITVEQYDEIWLTQGGTCAVCHGPEPVEGRALAVDHDHQTHRVRGLLCSNCNTGIGMFSDNPALLEAAIAYLKERS